MRLLLDTGSKPPPKTINNAPRIQEMAAKAAKYSIYCQRQAGILLAGMEMNKGAEGNSTNQHSKEVSSCGARAPKTLSEIGITYDSNKKELLDWAEET